MGTRTVDQKPVPFAQRVKEVLHTVTQGTNTIELLHVLYVCSLLMFLLVHEEINDSQ